METLTRGQADLARLHRHATGLLGEPVRLFEFSYDLQQVLTKKARRYSTRGISELPVVQYIHSGAGGHDLRCGVIHYVATIDGVAVPLLNVLDPLTVDPSFTFCDFWAVPEQHSGRLYRFLRQAARRQSASITAPIMRPEVQQRLWDNTLGFLQKGAEALTRFGVSLKRGVLLTGEPGNGKTLAARWLAAQAAVLGFDWRTVSAEDYEGARNRGNAGELFQLDDPGVILFDDFDLALRDREKDGPSVDTSTFLAELDGIATRSGVVYLFTSNAGLDELDVAFRRPGRIDQVITFLNPDAALRRRLIEERWAAEMLPHLPVAEIIEATAGCNFAEVDEIKKLLVLHYLDTHCWDWPTAWSRFCERGNQNPTRRRCGFANASQGSDANRLVSV